MLKRYGFVGLVYLSFCWIRGKLIFPNSKIIRFPIDIRGKRYMQVGKNFTTGRYCRLEVENINKIKANQNRLIIGKNVQLNDFCHITASEKVVIEDYVLIASKVYISDLSHGSYGFRDQHSNPNLPPIKRKNISSPVRIGKKVWLGDGVCVLPGVTIGEGSIIGANSVVTKSIPPFTIAAGIPAKPIKVFCFKTEKWIKII